MAENNSSAPLKTAEGAYPALPAPDTHCHDEDTGRDVWSYSAEQMRAYAAQAVAARSATPALPATEDSSAGDLAEADLSQISGGETPKPWSEAEKAWLSKALGTVFRDQAEAQAEPVADCYSDDDGDTWRDLPSDIDFVQGRKLGEEFELQASVRSWSETFRVTKVPDETSDDYEVEPVSVRTAPQAQPADALDADGEAFRTAAKLGLTLRFYGGCAQSSKPRTPSAYAEVAGPDPAASMREAVQRVKTTIDAAMAAAQEGGRAVKAKKVENATDDLSQ
ncbi:hypothetical protein [Comamonas sp. MYb396]|uniref:hypothetical protein n=1 Tax=Comamonas sp. MYb396 TaxID=2745302 RepID=UPI00309B878D